MSSGLPVTVLSASLALAACDGRGDASGVRTPARDQPAPTAANPRAEVAPADNRASGGAPSPTEEAVVQERAPTPSTPAPPAPLPGHTSKELAIACEIQSAGPMTVTYVAKNNGHDDAYLLDLTATRRDHATFDVDVKPIYLAWLGGRVAHLGQGIAPLPPDREVAVRIIPFATRLAPGASLTRRITLPLAELGPYDAPAGGPPVTIDRLEVSLSALRPSAPEFKREELAGHPGVFRVASKYTVGDVERVRCEVSFPPTELRTFTWDAARPPSFDRRR